MGSKSVEMIVTTSWEYSGRAVMFVTFEAEPSLFVNALDAVLANKIPILVGRLNRYVLIHLTCIMQAIFKTYDSSPPLEAFHTRESTIRRLIPKEILNKFKEYDYKVVGLWNHDNETEIYYMSTTPSEEVSYVFDQLSQSFCL